jgi:hypothetical protein
MCGVEDCTHFFLPEIRFLVLLGYLIKASHCWNQNCDWPSCPWCCLNRCATFKFYTHDQAHFCHLRSYLYYPELLQLSRPYWISLVRRRIKE